MTTPTAPASAHDQLAGRWLPGRLVVDAIEIVRTVSGVANASDLGVVDAVYRRDLPEATDVDVVDALSLMAAARRELDRDEALLIRAARARSVTWERIGLALGYSNPGAKQAGLGRARALGIKPGGDS